MLVLCTVFHPESYHHHEIPLLVGHLLVGIFALLFKTGVFAPESVERQIVFDNTLPMSVVSLCAVPWIFLLAGVQSALLSSCKRPLIPCVRPLLVPPIVFFVAATIFFCGLKCAPRAGAVFYITCAVILFISYLLIGVVFLLNRFELLTIDLINDNLPQPQLYNNQFGGFGQVGRAFGIESSYGASSPYELPLGGGFFGR
ncbi:hypothetical protein M3Y99_01511300 [Aphelenchoides fujianensis]|nr:hypothetical protein M3Y99_01511300 [Aphelenchoides fujianensis]